MSFAKFVHQIWEGLVKAGDVAFNAEEVSDQDVRNAIIDLLRDYPTSRSLFKHAIKLHDSRMQSEMTAGKIAELEHYYEDLRNEWYRQRFGLSPEEYESRVESVYEDIERSEVTDETARALDDMAADEYAARDKQNKESDGTESNDRENQGSSPILPSAQPDRREGASGDVQERPETVSSDSDSARRDASENAAEEVIISEHQEQPHQRDVEPDGFSDFGPVFTQFKGDAQGAIRALSELQDGEAVGALHHKDVGDIDLVWGKSGTAKSDGFGLAKLIKFHPEVIEHLQEILDDMHIIKRSENRINLESDTHKAAIRLTWNKEKKKWLLTAFEKKETSESIDKMTDTDNNPMDLRGDTALSQNSDVSDGKDTTLPSDKQEGSAKSSVAESPTNSETTASEFSRNKEE